MPEALSLLRSLRSLDLSSNAIATLPNGSLAALAGLHELKLHRNDLDVVQDDAFRGLHASLASLSLDFCSLRTVPTAAMRPLANLVSLDITGRTKPRPYLHNRLPLHLVSHRT